VGYYLVRFPLERRWLLLVTLAATCTLKSSYALRVQDRVIRLEERVRLMSLLQEPLRSRIGELRILSCRAALRLRRGIARAAQRRLTKTQPCRHQESNRELAPDYSRI